jgi:hypothetical protein
MSYTYLIGWSKQGKYYYGARWAKNCSEEDLWKTYFTSSKHVKEFRALFGEPDIVEVRKTFTDPNVCKIYEQRVLKRLNVLNNKKWLNRSINGRFLPHGKQTEAHTLNRVKSLVEGGKRKGKVAWTAASHPEYAKRVSLKLKGMKKTESHKEKMKTRPQNVIKLTCPHCGKNGDYKNMKRWHMDNCNQSHRPE